MNEKRDERRELWSQRVIQQEKSGESIREFCRQRGLSENALYSWRQRLRKKSAVSFALVETKPPAAAAAGIEIVLASGDRLQVPADEATLRMVLRVLRDRP